MVLVHHLFLMKKRLFSSLKITKELLPKDYSKIKKFIFSLLLAFSLVGCKTNKKNIELVLLYETKIDLNTVDSINSKIAISDTIFLIKNNQFYRSVNDISNSKIEVLVRGKESKNKISRYSEIIDKFNLKEIDIKKFIFPDNDKIPSNLKCSVINITDSNKIKGFNNVIKVSKNLGVFQYYQNETYNKAKLKICNKEFDKIFDFDVKGYSPSINLMDITGDNFAF